jgi:hypothetical protein
MNGHGVHRVLWQGERYSLKKQAASAVSWAGATGCEFEDLVQDFLVGCDVC